MEQGSWEWKLARVGKVTASRVADIVAKTKSGYASSRANYMAELVVERISGLPYDDKFVTEDMLRGTEMEPLARARYEEENFVTVEQVGLIVHPHIPGAAASPDGIIDSKKLLEIKCPKTSTHMETYLTETVPQKYVTQIHWQAACTGIREADFVSFDPRCPEDLQYVCIPVEISGRYVSELEGEVCKFLVELDERVGQIQARRMRRAA